MHLRWEDVEALEPHDEAAVQQTSWRQLRVATTTIKRSLNGRRRFVDGLAVALAQASMRELTEAVLKMCRQNYVSPYCMLGASRVKRRST